MKQTSNYTFIVNENDYENADDGYESNDVGAEMPKIAIRNNRWFEVV